MIGRECDRCGVSVMFSKQFQNSFKTIVPKKFYIGTFTDLSTVTQLMVICYRPLQFGSFGFERGQGCESCDCAVGASNTECDPYTGQCTCHVGVTGRRCDQCLPGYWNLGPNGCERMCINTNLGTETHHIHIS